MRIQKGREKTLENSPMFYMSPRRPRVYAEVGAEHKAIYHETNNTNPQYKEKGNDKREKIGETFS